MKYIIYFTGNFIICFCYGIYTFYNVANINNVGLGLKFWFFGLFHLLSIFVICPIVLPRGQRMEGVLLNLGSFILTIIVSSFWGFGYIAQYIFG